MFDMVKNIVTQKRVADPQDFTRAERPDKSDGHGLHLTLSGQIRPHWRVRPEMLLPADSSWLRTFVPVRQKCLWQECFEQFVDLVLAAEIVCSVGFSAEADMDAQDAGRIAGSEYILVRAIISHVKRLFTAQ